MKSNFHTIFGKKMWLMLISIVIILVIGLFIYYKLMIGSNRTQYVIKFLREPYSYKDLIIIAGSRCDESVFEFPSTGMVGFIWDDSFRPGHRHQGIDIFSGTKPGETAVFAAYDGYLTRLPEWKSSLIIRIPNDPINNKQQIWIYYAHLADANGNSFINEEFPPGTYEIPINSGDLLGYQGNYSGKVGSPVGVHLHFSVVKDDGTGKFLNELDFNNTLDPSAYFNLDLNANVNPDLLPLCGEN